MRLSEVLSKAPSSAAAQVENFLGSRRILWGKLKTLQVGKVIRNCYCYQCQEVRTFLSGDSLSCLVTGDDSVSIDVALRCSACGQPIEAWFLVKGDDDLFGQAPWVHLERYTENRRPGPVAGTDASPGPERLDELLERARIAFEAHLGAGAMIYLRKIYEIITSEAATAVGIPTRRADNRRKSFGSLLREVDEATHIIPAEFSANRYKLFSELSELIHGDASESEALARFEPCRQLVVGIISNIQNSRQMASAVAALGWDLATPSFEVVA